ncbi:MAG: hypothetical protein ABFD50_08370 [Smithella sp.]
MQPMENKWTYQEVLEANKVENKFDNFLRFLTTNLESKRKRAKAVGALPSEHPKLDYTDCALVYNPYSQAKHPKIMLYSPLFLEGLGEHTPHLIMMAVLANMISDKDPEFEALISKKTAEYLALFEA